MKRLSSEGRKEGSSFSEEKEAKRLSDLAPVPDRETGRQVEKFFGSFFQKRTACFPMPPAAAARVPSPPAPPARR
jgi:hypothetical protein